MLVLALTNLLYDREPRVQITDWDYKKYIARQYSYC